jgi:hypothetical protein
MTLLLAAVAALAAVPAFAITSVTLPGAFQSELGCAGDWMPDGACTHLALQGDGNWTGTFNIPAGTYEYKVAIDDSWAENYGIGGALNGANYSLTLANPQNVTFTYDPVSHIVTNDAAFVQPTSVTLPGSFQSEVGCAGDWMPDGACTHLTLQGNGHWTGAFTIPAGSYEYKVAINDSWTENYGAGGVPGGANLTLVLGADGGVAFDYDPVSHVVTQSAGLVVTAAGSFQSEAGCAGDWDPTCANTDLAAAGATYEYTSPSLPEGNYEFKITIGHSWGENYGENGVPGGNNITFTIPAGGGTVAISYNPTTHVATATPSGSVPTKHTSWGHIKTLYR